MTLKEIAIELFNHSEIEDIHMIDLVVVFYHHDREYNIRFSDYDQKFILNLENGLNIEFDNLQTAIDFVLV